MGLGLSRFQRSRKFNAPFTCAAGCISLLGLEGGGIAESQISASSVRYTVLGLQRWGPELARLHNKGLVNAWSPASHDRNPWIEVRRWVTLHHVCVCV